MNEHDRLWGPYTTASTGPHTPLTLEDMEAAIEKLRGLPPVKWMLVAPDGLVWTISRYAKEVMNSEPWPDDVMISFEAWRACAEHINKKIENRK